MPMPASEVQQLIEEAIPGAQVRIEDLAGDNDHYVAHVAATTFDGMSRIQQHQLVYAALGGRVGGQLHALSVKTSVLKNSQ